MLRDSVSHSGNNVNDLTGGDHEDPGCEFHIERQDAIRVYCENGMVRIEQETPLSDEPQVVYVLWSLVPLVCHAILQSAGYRADDVADFEPPMPGYAPERCPEPEVPTAKPKDSTNAERQRRHRDRKRAQRNSEHDGKRNADADTDGVARNGPVTVTPESAAAGSMA